MKKAAPAELIALFDANALVHRAYHAIKPLTTSRGEMTNAVFGFTTTMLKAFADLRPSRAAVAFDRAAPTYRHQEYVDYKANRVRMADDLRPQFARVRELVTVLGLPIYEVDAFEADDVLGTLARQAVDLGLDVVVVTGDTDALQLVSPKVRVLVPSRGIADAVLYDEARVRERYGLEPAQMIDYKALKGDPSDNIRGVPGIGEKTAQRLLSRYGTIERLLENPDDLEPKAAVALRENADPLRLGKRLVTIQRDAPVELDLESSRIGHYDRAQAVALLRELEFRSLIDRLPQPPTKAPTANGAVRQTRMFDEAAESAGAATERASEAPAVPRLGDYRIVRTPDELTALVADLKSAGAFSFAAVTLDGSPREAALCGLSFSSRPEAGWYVPLGHQGLDGPQLTAEAALERLAELFGDPEIAKYGHNAKSSLHVLARHGIGVAGVTFDTMIAAFVLDSSLRALGLRDIAWSRLGLELVEPSQITGKGKNQISLAACPLEAVADLAAAEADVCLRLKQLLAAELERTGLTRVFADIEIPCVPVLTAMEQAGIKIDADYLRAMSDEMATQVAQAETDIWDLVGHQFNIGSPPQLGKVLFEELKLPRGKRTKTGWSTDADTLEELRGAHPVIDRLFEYRQIAKLKSTYVDALPALMDQATHRVHTSYNQVGASTGRLSSSDPNLQNIPIRSELGRAVRRAFVADGPDMVLLGADYSQVELRILAHITRDEALLRAFGDRQDIHRATASLILGVSLEEVSPDQRRFAKVVNFGIAYGLGAYGLSVQAGISQQEAGQFIRAYLERYTGIARYIEEIKAKAEDKGYVETLLGRRIQIPEIASPNRQVRAGAERRAINAPIQGSNADFMKLAMARIHDALTARGLRTRLILQVHDELVFEAPRDEVETVAALAREILCSAYPLDPPLEVETKVGTNWSDVE